MLYFPSITTKMLQVFVDTSSPVRYSHLERCIEIEKNNKILLDKMSRIMNKTTHLPKHNSHKSLNVGNRKKNLINIANENQAC